MFSEFDFFGGIFLEFECAYCYLVTMLCFRSCSSGVADGVGGWRSYGVDPSLFPQSLMAACERLVKAGRFTPQKPIEVLSTGYYEVQQDKKPLIGMLMLQCF